LRGEQKKRCRSPATSYRSGQGEGGKLRENVFESGAEGFGALVASIGAMVSASSEFGAVVLGEAMRSDFSVLFRSASLAG